MNVIPLSEAKANLSRYGRMCLEEPVIITVRGVPCFQLVPLEEDDDMVNRLLAENPRFVRTFKKRSRERTVSANAARRRW
jgi:prevent-host-death family protein